MQKSIIDLNRPAYSLTVGELVNIIIDNLPTRSEQAKAEPRQPIKGIHAIAKYLGVSPAKAQAMKNSGILPYFQNGRIVLFDCDKIDEIMYTIKKAK